MTVCIAAACEHEEEPRIVLCHDWQQEVEGVGASENRNKLDWVKDGWPVLISDTLCHAEALIGVYVEHLSKTTLTEDNVLSELKTPPQLYKGILANDYIQQTLGVDYNYFLQYGKSRFPEDFFREKMAEISRIRLGASLIIAGFAMCKKIGPYNEGLNAFLCVVEDTEEHHDTVRLETDFATIGSGAYGASAALFRRNQHWERNLMYTIYSVFEAKRFAEKVPGVGRNLMSIDIVEPSGIRALSDSGYEYCEELYKRYGPREVLKKHRGKFEVRAEFLGPFETTADNRWD